MRAFVSWFVAREFRLMKNAQGLCDALEPAKEPEKQIEKDPEPDVAEAARERGKPRTSSEAVRHDFAL